MRCPAASPTASSGSGYTTCRVTSPESSTTRRSAIGRPRRCTSTSTSAAPRFSATVGVGAPGRRQTLPDLVRDYLRRRPLPAELDREEFVRLGGDLMDAVERDLAGT